MARPSTNATTERLTAAVDNLFALIIRHQGEATRHGVPLTPPQRVGLRLIIDGGPLRLKDLAEKMASTQSKASRIVAALRGLDLVRTVTDPSDGRAILITATAAGRQVARERHRSLVRAIEEAFGTIDQPSQERLAEMLEQLEPLLTGFPGGRQDDVEKLRSAPLTR